MMRTWTWTRLAVLVGGLSLGPSSVTGQENSRSDPKVGTAPSEAEARELAEKMESAMDARDVEAALALIDLDALTEKAVEGVPGEKEFLEGVRDGIRRSSAKGNYVTRFIEGRPGEVSDFRFLKVQEKAGSPHLLYRIIFEDGGLTYLDLELAMRPGKKVRVVDMTNYTAGESLSETVRRTLIQLVPSAENDKIVAKLGEMTQACDRNDFREALVIYDRMPAQAQAMKAVKMLRIRAAQGLGGEVYEEAIRDLLASFPDEAGFQLLLIDLDIIQERYDELQKTLGQIRKHVGPDAYLDVLSSNAYASEGEPEKARKAAEKALEAEPTLGGGALDVSEPVAGAGGPRRDVEGTEGAARRV